MKTHKFIIIIMLFIITSILMGCTEQKSQNGEQDTDFYIYENLENNVRMEYPKNWTKKENYLPDAIVTFLPKEALTGSLSTSLSISVLDLEEHMDMEWFKQAHIENLSLYLTDVNITYNNTTTLSGFNGHKLIFTFKQGTFTFKQMELWTIDDYTLYLLVYSGEKSIYNEYLSSAEQMINSFTLL